MLNPPPFFDILLQEFCFRLEKGRYLFKETRDGQCQSTENGRGNAHDCEERTEPTQGVAVIEIPAAGFSDHYTANIKPYDSVSGRLVRAYSYLTLSR